MGMAKGLEALMDKCESVAAGAGGGSRTLTSSLEPLMRMWRFEGYAFEPLRFACA